MNKRCFILGTGPSLNDIDLSLLKNEVTIGVNNIIKSNIKVDYLVVSDLTFLEEEFQNILTENNKDVNFIFNGGSICENGGYLKEQLKDSLDSYNEKYNNIKLVKHWEKSGKLNYLSDGTELPFNKPKDIVRSEYYIDRSLEKFSVYGGSVVKDLAIPTAVHFGFKEIYLLGCDGGFTHFYDEDNSGASVRTSYYTQKFGKDRPGLNYDIVKEFLDNMGVQLYSCLLNNRFNIKYRNFKEVINEKNN